MIYKSDRFINLGIFLYWLAIIWAGIHLMVLVTRLDRLIDMIAASFGAATCIVIAAFILKHLEDPAKDLYDTLEKQQVFLKMKLGRIQPRDFYEIVRAYIVRTKESNSLS